MFLRTTALVLWLLFASSAGATDLSDLSDEELHALLRKAEAFELGTECEQVWVGSFVEMPQWMVQQAMKTMGITEAALTATVRHQLRTANLARPMLGNPQLHLALWGNDTRIVVSLALKKSLYDPVSHESFPATTWKTETIAELTGLPDSGAALLSLLTNMTKNFIDAYLRVNAPACQAK